MTEAGTQLRPVVL
uniref:Uncharacterized protein n=1 Tax=Mus musculus TaxID=10090 RepID=C0LMV2_MOUSE|nr:hypothetical protein MGT-6S [Mus musculus]ACO92347.1 hypothetical protein MGT-6S [Mus musculus]ACO92348.1 hypothetical protein MGT-6S [Mus musculus]